MRAGGEHLPSLFKREKARKFHITLDFSHHWPETKSDDPLSGVPPLDSGRWSFGRMYGCLSENAMAPHSSTLAWKIPWMEEPGRLRSMGSLRVRYDFTFTFTFHFHALEKEMATHSSVLAWRIPGTGEPGGLPSMGSHRVGHG